MDHGNLRSDSISESRRQARSEMRLRRDVVRLRALGSRVVYELLVELGRAWAIGADIEERVTRYVTRLEPDILAVIGGDKMPPRPLWLVQRAEP
jgi:hypothetical protein